MLKSFTLQMPCSAIYFFILLSQKVHYFFLFFPEYAGGVLEVRSQDKASFFYCAMLQYPDCSFLCSAVFMILNLLVVFHKFYGGRELLLYFNTSLTLTFPSF